MAERGRFSGSRSGGRSYAGIPAQIINQIRKQSEGENTSNTSETVRPNTDTNKNNSIKTPEEIAANKSDRRRVYTPEQIAADPELSMMKNALSTMTYEQALANYRAFTKVTNMIPLAKENESTKYKAKATQMVRRSAAAMAKLTPEQKAAERIFFAMGGSIEANNSRYGGYGTGINRALYESLGITPPTTSYAPVKFDVNNTANTIEFKLANPLNATQKTAIQRLRSLSKSGVKLTSKQQARFAKLKAIKNAPTIIP